MCSIEWKEEELELRSGGGGRGFYGIERRVNVKVCVGGGGGGGLEGGGGGRSGRQEFDSHCAERCQTKRLGTCWQV